MILKIHDKFSIKKGTIKPICFLMHLPLAPENIRKSKSFLMFSGGRERANWEQMA